MQPTFRQLPPLSLYIHIPWCVRKCPYCDFNSHAVTGDLPEQQYISTLISDLDNDLSYVQNRELSSIFFGGGTPSLLSTAGVDKIIQSVAKRIRLSNNAEITLEANPGTFEQQKFAGYREVGVNRLSIGIQSFNQQQLQHLGRIHSSDEAIHAAQQAKSCGFDNFNLDLMHGLYRQSPELALEDLQKAITLNPSHLSWYQLTIEPNTEFYNQPPLLPDDDLLYQIEQQGQALLQQEGYRPYEVSAYCQSGKESVHNLNYWQFGDYIGIGAGAHGKITQLEQQQIVRTRKTRLPKDYMKSTTSISTTSEAIPPLSIPGEFLMNALRMNQGFTPRLFEDRTGLPFSGILPAITKAQTDGLIESGAQVKTTKKGRLFLNNLLERFI